MPEIEWKSIQPPADLSDFVESFWMLTNMSDTAHEIVVLPDGRFDIIFSYSDSELFHATLRGLDTRPDTADIPAKAVMFAVSFKILAIEYLLQIKAADVLNGGYQLPTGFWEISKQDLDHFELFCEKLSAKMRTLIVPGMDNRKKTLFGLIYDTHGAANIKELSEKVFWSSRQINRYFNQQFGISLKAYCNIIRFRTALYQIKEGRLFPDEDFADQNHFIREVKKFSGVVPKELFRNQNDRFILFSTLPGK